MRLLISGSWVRAPRWAISFFHFFLQPMFSVLWPWIGPVDSIKTHFNSTMPQYILSGISHQHEDQYQRHQRIWNFRAKTQAKPAMWPQRLHGTTASRFICDHAFPTVYSQLNRILNTNLGAGKSFCLNIVPALSRHFLADLAPNERGDKVYRDLQVAFLSVIWNF